MRTLSQRARAVALHLLAAAAIATALYPGLRHAPVAVDEGLYHFVTRQLQGWLAELVNQPGFAVSEPGIQRYWSFNHEHPALPKLLAAGSNVLLGGRIDPIAALRFGNVGLAILLVFEIFHFTRRHFGSRAGLFAGGAVLLIPCLYGHACTLSMDFPVAALGLLATTAFVRGTERPVWALAFGLYLGLAFNTKINAFFIPLPLIVWGLVYRRRQCAPNLFALMLLAPALWWATWPWLWHQTGSRILEYLKFHLHHQHHNLFYLGRFYDGSEIPLHYPLVYFLTAVPLSILLPALLSIGAAALDLTRPKAQQNPIVILLAAAAATPLLVAAFPGVPKYDGPRLFLNAFPPLACLAGVGSASWMASLERLSRRLRPIPAGAAAWGLGALLLLPAAASSWRIHPFQAFSFYNLLVGGPSGAFALGLSPVHWGMAPRSAVDYLNRNARPGDALYDNTGAVVPLQAYMAAGKLRQDLRFDPHPDWVVLEYNLEYSKWSDWWLFYEDRQPWFRRVLQVRADGVPVLGVFRARSQPLRDASGAIPPALVTPKPNPARVGAESGIESSHR